MPGGWMIGLGQGIQKAGDAYANAKQEAIARMFRERQMALQEQQLREQIREAQFQDANKMIGQMPAGTELNLDQFGPGGAPVVQAFSKETSVPDQTSPLLGAKTLPVPIAGAPTLDVQGPQAALAQPSPGRVTAQDLSPKVTKRVSVPTEDAKYRAAVMADMTRNRIADQSNASRLQISQAKLALQAELSRETNALRREQLQQGLMHLDILDRSLASQNMYRGAQIDNMNYDNALAEYIAQNGRPSTAGAADDPIRTAVAQIMMQSMGAGAPGGAAPTLPVPGATPENKPPRPAPPAAPTIPGGHARPGNPNDPGGLFQK